MGKIKSIFTNEEWANLKRMLSRQDTVMMAVDILGGSDLSREVDMYKVYFLLTQHRIVPASEGPRVTTVNYFWRLTERLKQEILSLQPWLNVDGGRIEDPHTNAELGRPRARPVGNRHLHSQQGGRLRQGPIRPKAS